MKIEEIEDRTRQKEHISFYCSSKLRNQIVDCSKRIKSSISSTIRKLILVSLESIKEGGK